MVSPSWEPDGTQWARLKPTGPDRVRTAWDNQVGEHGQYLRFWSRETFTPPYVWSGRVRPISTMIPPVFDSPRPDNSGNVTDVCWYIPALNFYPMRVDGSNNVILQTGFQSDPAKVAATAKYLGRYGARSGYEERYLSRMPGTIWDDRWHDFRIVVPSYGEYRLFWDGVLRADIKERAPYTVSGPVRVGFRLDFCDVEFAEMTVTGF